jgi:hypothetical protein
MSGDTEVILREKINVRRKFSLQIDESTDISGDTQLITNIQYVDGDIITSNFFSCKELPERATGSEIFHVTDEYLHENGLQWKDCIGVCTDVASLMTGKVRGFMAKVQEVNPEIRFDHCLIHCEAIVAKTLPVFLKNVLDEVIKIVSFIKTWPLNSQLFFSLCQVLGSEHTSLLLHTEVQWLSHEKALTRVF